MRWIHERLEPSKFAYSYAWLTLLKSNVTSAGGSDAPVEHCSPFKGIHDAMYRCSRPADQPSAPEGESKKESLILGQHEPTTQPRGAEERRVFRSDECLTFAQALWLYTIGAAKAANVENCMGKLEPNHIADFVVIEKKALENPAQLYNLSPCIVFVGGRIAFLNHENQLAMTKIKLNGTTLKMIQNERKKNASLNDVSNGPLYKTNQLLGPFIPGKNGGFRCACMFLGKNCSAFT
jgi:hypothetical protein